MRRNVVRILGVAVIILVAECFSGAWAGQNQQVAAAGDAGQEDGDLGEVFTAVDADHDDRLSLDEYAAIWKSGMDVERKFLVFDRDGSGFIERQEFLSLPGQALQ